MPTPWIVPFCEHVQFNFVPESEKEEEEVKESRNETHTDKHTHNDKLAKTIYMCKCEQQMSNAFGQIRAKQKQKITNIFYRIYFLYIYIYSIVYRSNVYFIDYYPRIARRLCVPFSRSISAIFLIRYHNDTGVSRHIERSDQMCFIECMCTCWLLTTNTRYRGICSSGGIFGTPFTIPFKLLLLSLLLLIVATLF